MKSEQRNPLPGIPARTYLTHQALWRGLPLLQSEAVQLGPGSHVYEMLQVTGRDMLIFRSNFAPKMASTIVTHPDWMVLMVPVRWLGDHVLNGQLARPFDVFVFAGPDGYSSTGMGRHNLSLGIRKSKLKETCAIMSGRCIDDINLDDQRMALGPGLGTTFHRRILETIAASLEEPIGPGKFALETAIENDLFAEIAGLIIAQTIEENAVSSPNLDALRVVRRAENLFEDRATYPPSIADLCKAANVGATKLRVCFNEVFGVAPIAYLQAKRLTQARSLFLAEEGPPPSVKYAALSLGFTHSGRFARQYRSVFGELPSETLEKR
ncbi:AraC family transcriptional regulator [Shimia aestuarii]|uniref:AraC-type DNA-binding protein n=1 Tax=Shimia aestuarii TaxID=254406 RepID=A0A1I4IS59_9RHOB|nr:AraC family transcriptional regulator [Shimia aestuarii]SFL56681.1 AraC-type DNA-binding protein [Shimia aestuarii]